MLFLWKKKKAVRDEAPMMVLLLESKEAVKERKEATGEERTESVVRDDDVGRGMKNEKKAKMTDNNCRKNLLKRHLIFDWKE